MSMLVLARFQTERGLLVGDPLQLPPTLPGTSVKEVDGLERTLFERLSTCVNSKPILLRTQYRCHPRIAEMSNVLFYKRELKHGLTELQLAPLLTGIPTLSFIQSGGSEMQVNISFVNKPEATSIVELVNVLLGKEVDPSEIGVIALYKGQADLISQMIQESGKSKGIQVRFIVESRFNFLTLYS
jgi:superfamily I DNA and/or RNA helicase